MKVFLTAALCALILAGCGVNPPVSGPAAKAGPPAATAKSGGYYLDDGPPAHPPADLDAVPDAVFLAPIEPEKTRAGRLVGGGIQAQVSIFTSFLQERALL